MEGGGALEEIDKVHHMEIVEFGYVICCHLDPLKTSHSKPCICVSSHKVGSCFLFTYVYQYAWLMHNKDTSTEVEIQDVVAHLLRRSKELSVWEMLRGAS